MNVLFWKWMKQFRCQFEQFQWLMGQVREMVNFEGQEITGQRSQVKGHTMPKIDLEAWQRCRSRPFVLSSSFNCLQFLFCIIYNNQSNDDMLSLSCSRALLDIFCRQIPVLICELIATEIWKEKVFPEFLDLQLEQELLFPIYIVVGILLQLFLLRLLHCHG